MDSLCKHPFACIHLLYRSSVTYSFQAFQDNFQDDFGTDMCRKVSSFDLSGSVNWMTQGMLLSFLLTKLNL